MGNRTSFWVVIALVLIATMAEVGFHAHGGVAHRIAENTHAVPGAPVSRKNRIAFRVLAELVCPGTTILWPWVISRRDNVG